MAITNEQKAKLDKEAEGIGSDNKPNHSRTEGDSDLPERPLDEAISELERELLVRERCYGRWVEDGKMSRVDAVDRFLRLKSAVVYLRRLVSDSGLSVESPVNAENVPF